MADDGSPMMEMDGVGSESGDIRHLFSYNLQRLAGMSSRVASLSLERDHGLTVQEWRTLAVLDFLEAAPLHLLAHRAGVQKSQMSRLITDLEERKLVCREPHPVDKRSVLLRLTANAQDLVREVLASSRSRNDLMLSYLDAEERKYLMRLMGRVIQGTSRLLADVKGETDTAVPGTLAPATFYEPDA